VSDLPRGARVKFRAKFDGGDPKRVAALVISRNVRQTFGADSITREGHGVYAIEVLLREDGPLLVRFESGEGEFSEVVYQVADPAPRVEPSHVDDLVPVVDASARAILLDEIRELGIVCNEDRSDDYLSAVLAEHRRQLGEAARRDANERAQSAWKK
jgi:hypothetical protein